MRKSTAFVPAHISGFFQPCYASTPERTGSRNCGPCIKLGVTTEVRAEPSDRNTVKVNLNGRRAPDARTTMAAVDLLLRMARGSFNVEVDHHCEVPVGAGYGASGAGALGAALALSRTLGLKLKRAKIVEVAHVAEVTCRTGLGDVGAQAVGGLVMGMRPGAPPHGRWAKIAVPPGLRIVCATRAPLSTKEFLREESFRTRAGMIGRLAMERLAENPTPERFVAVSNHFAGELGLLDGELKALISAAEDAGAIGASQVMLGRAIFAFTNAKKARTVEEAFLRYIPPEQVMVSGLDAKGART